MTEHRIVLVFCCEGLRVAPAHGHRPTPVCLCGWIGEEHTSQLEANRSAAGHLNHWSSWGVPYAGPICLSSQALEDIELRLSGEWQTGDEDD